MSKYIIRNCPALYFSLGFYCNEYQKYCQDCTDCLLKQIVRTIELECICPPSSTLNPHVKRVTDEILQLFDITKVD